MRAFMILSFLLSAGSAFACDEQLSRVEISRPDYWGFWGVRYGKLNGQMLTKANGKPFNVGTDEVAVVEDRRKGPEGLVAIRSHRTGIGFFNKEGKIVFGAEAPRHQNFGKAKFRWDDMTANAYYLRGSIYQLDPQTHEFRGIGLEGDLSYEHLIFPVVRLKQGFLVVRWQSEISGKLQFSIYSHTGHRLVEMYSYHHDEFHFHPLKFEDFFDVAQDGTLTFYMNFRSGKNAFSMSPDGKVSETEGTGKELHPFLSY